MNLPNALTLLRIFFVPLLVAVLVQEKSAIEIAGWKISNQMAALVIFLSAAGTDLLDGYLARRWNQITTVGMLLDPVADKLLVSAALIALVQIHLVPAWMAVLIIGREFAVSGLRSIAAAEGFTIEASELGKSKMVAQVAAIALTLVAADFPRVHPAATAALWGAMLFGLVSAAGYARDFWHRIDESVKERRRIELLRLERERRRELRRQRRLARQGLLNRAAPETRQPAE
ncbi:MAG: CDP-diacylglycerol--glycerol-3-phosphate 3-phosphatidyltransferase [Bryobacteraceae bacterium]|nr:CDP-diacylglycerol--glycerol-3-phosphate 3-phosphatidyltransferase [Bryobacteraceae bacterium]